MKTKKKSSPQIEVISPRSQAKTKQKSFSPETEVIFPQNQVKTKKKRSSPQFATIFGRKFVGSFSPSWLFFLWSSSAQLLMGGSLNLDGGTLNLDGGTLTIDGGDASLLQFEYWRITVCCPRLKCKQKPLPHWLFISFKML